MTEATSAKPWLATYGDSIPAEIDANAYTSVVDMLEQAMRRYADRIAFRSFSNAITFVRIPEKATTLSGAWRPRDPVNDDQGGARA